ncbi:Hsp70 family protein [Tautonia rosea]|uniref:Hsp70 family protein n=1 Tax=Tautonia rosea TaxID=2728037 RepID=UPI0014745AFF|nr:Hsp70 family protein [Tautonia rosea]
MSRFVVGIDLGTTNSALAYVDSSEATEERPAPVRALAIPQLVAVNDVSERSVLPSFLYLPSEKDFPAGSTDLPWSKKPERVVGVLAREHGAKVPGRLVGSAKSWLCYEGVDRETALLPWNAPEDVPKVSPVEASSAYLGYLRDVWNAQIAGKKSEDRLEKQQIYLTVPASFDAVARELTVEAAKGVGLDQVTLLEEPQAAFYAWLSGLGDEWRKRVTLGDLILVCDVGGGTTDFTLIGVAEQDGDLVLNRLAVGEHILLGGDNMDLALAHAVAATMPGGMESLDPTQRVGLTYACRNAKETLLSKPDLDSVTVSVLGRGSKVIGGAVKADLTRSTLQAVLLDGFFPRCEANEQPARGRRIGLTEIGLPYAADPAITRHLARFLSRQGQAVPSTEGIARPSAVLFNGGVFQSSGLRDRVSDTLSDWGGEPITVLSSDEPDLAVARGAAYYGMVRQGKGIRIRGGVPRSYYVGIETSAPAVPGIPAPIKALCVVPMGMEEGTEANVPGSELGLVVGESAEFRFLASTVRRNDTIGTVLDRWSSEELVELAPLVMSLGDQEGEEGEVVPVSLHSIVTEVGTLELWCEATRSPGRWKLEFNVREQGES